MSVPTFSFKMDGISKAGVHVFIEGVGPSNLIHVMHQRMADIIAGKEFEPLPLPPNEPHTRNESGGADES